jgi:hypothetical protein
MQAYKFKPTEGETANGSIDPVIIYMMVRCRWITVAILELIHA